ncbi:MAG: helix-turn-helix domain-containing protein [Clostridium sp.]|nr:helix-turn-helix domain-containing protein [Bacteroides sp.]MCM1199283.1 helix-turn-helix domain-containing protein [Clostridium sp.]
MKDILKVKSPGDFCSHIGAEDRHPLVAVIDFEQVSPIPSSVNSYEVYGLFMHSKVREDLIYGSGRFGSGDGKLICVAPGQIGGREDTGGLIDIDGWALLFHPDLLVGTQLEKDIRSFSFFDYSANEALFMDEQEEEMATSIIRSIQNEINREPDEDRNKIITSYISALLHYCNRFYHRQFTSIRRNSEDILVKFSALLNEYFDCGRQLSEGIPGVQYFADRMCMSPNYFSDMLKKTTGENASNFIRSHIIRIAKNMLVASGNISEVAYSLGFEYPQHFTRMFRKQTGMTPTQYLESI